MTLLAVGLLTLFISIQIVQGEQTCGAGKCYTYDKIRSSFTESGNSCRTKGSSLATVASSAEQKVLEQAMAANRVSVTWIDVREEEGYKQNWRWRDGTLLQAQGCYYEYYGSRSFINETLITGLTPNKCIESCKSLGFLYSSVQEGTKCYCGSTPSNYLTDQGCTTLCNGDSAQWCGAYGKGFVYYNHGTYGEWAYNQPNNVDSREDCAAILSVDSRYRFSDRDCTTKLLYICEIANSATCTSTASDSTGHYVKTSSKCVYVGTTAVDWYTAVTQCTAREGELVIIKSRAVHDVYQTVIQDLKTVGKVPTEVAGPMLWIGLQKRMFRSHFSNGVGAADSILNYYNFADGQPDWFMWRCVQVNGTDGYKWVEVSCDTLYTNQPFFCESAYNETDPTTTATTITETTVTSMDMPSQNSPTTSNQSSSDAPATTTITTPTSPTSTTPKPTTTSATTTTTAAATTAASTGSVTPEAGASTANTGSMSTLEIVFLVICLILMIALVVVIVVFVLYKTKNNERNRIEPEYSGASRAQPARYEGRYDGRERAGEPAGGSLGANRPYIHQGDNDSNYSADTMATSETAGYGSRQGIFIKDKDMWK